MQGRTSTILAVAAAAMLATAPTASAQDVVTGAAADAGGLQATVDQFRASLGALNANLPGSRHGGRREINWDGVPDERSAPNLLPANFFNTNSPRGVVFTGSDNFQVSADGDNPTGTPIEFGDRNPNYPSEFEPFSPLRLFAALDTNVIGVEFFVPGTVERAVTRGFGAVFTDVDEEEQTSIEFFDVFGDSLGVYDAPAQDKGLSFVGVRFPANLGVAFVEITAGDTAMGPDDGAGTDVVAMDDFIYGEPDVECFGGVPTRVGTDGDDRLLGGTGVDVIRGGDGDDVIGGRGGNDLLCGERGADHISGFNGDDAIDGGSEALAQDGPGSGDEGDFLDGGPGDDFVLGLEGGDRIYGANGGDFLVGEQHSDRVFGGANNDVIRGGSSPEDDTGTDRLHGEDGNDGILGSQGLDLIRGGLGDDVGGGLGGNDHLFGGPGADRLGEPIEVVRGDELVLFEETGDDRMRGEEGNDDLEGGPGTDFLDGDEAFDRCLNGESLQQCEDTGAAPAAAARKVRRAGHYGARSAMIRRALR